MQLKVELHSHSGEDPKDTWIRHSARQLIERASELGYDALAISNHKSIAHTSELERFAQDHGIVLIPAMEADVVDKKSRITPIRRKHVLLYCQSDPSAVSYINRYSLRRNGDLSFEDIAWLAETELVRAVGAPHPKHGPGSLNGSFADYLHLLHIVELSWFHTGILFPEGWESWNFLNRNQPVQIENNGFGLPYFASSDAHRLRDFGRAYSLVTADKNLDSIMEALQSRDPSRIRAEVKPLTVPEYFLAIPGLIFPRALGIFYE